jgi:uncharacterized protein
LIPALRYRSLGPLRTFALAAAFTVVIAHLLPEAASALGAQALLYFVVGFGLPVLAERAGPWLVKLARFRRTSDRHQTVQTGSAVPERTDSAKSLPNSQPNNPPERGNNSEPLPDAHAHEVPALSEDDKHAISFNFGYLGLLLHQLVEGTALWAYGTANHRDVALALVAHTVPLTALVVLGFGGRLGIASGLWRAAGLALASLIGMGIGRLLGVGHDQEMAPWLGAVAAGLLMHFLLHDLRADLPKTTLSRTFDLLALVVGVALTFLGMHAHQSVTGEPGQVQQKFFHSLADLTMDTAPMLLVGLALGALVQTLGGKIPTSWIRGGNSFSQACRGAVMGAPIPLCACGILPVSRSLVMRGAGTALVVSFLIATPELGVETFTLSTRFLGIRFAIVRIVGALLVAIITAWMVGIIHKRLPESDDAPGSVPLHVSHTNEQDLLKSAAVWPRYRAAFDEMMLHTAPWVLVGLIAAAYLDSLVPAAEIAALTVGGKDVFWVTIIAIPSYVCAASATPLAAILLAKGMSPGAVLVGLLLGPATNVATLVFLAKTYGKRSAIAGVTVLVLVTWAIAMIANQFLKLEQPGTLTAASGHEHEWLAMTAGTVLAILVLRALWLSGARSWVASLLGTQDHEHHHEHAH